MKSIDETAELRAGVAYALLAYVLWGLIPIAFKWVEEVAALGIIAHRIIWSMLLTFFILLLQKNWQQFIAVLKSPKILGGLMLSSSLIALNWLVFVWAVNHDRILETSLGYYITPLISVILGMFFLGERLRRLEWLALSFAMAGSAWLFIGYGTLPWVSLVLAVSFGLYGLIRKKLPVNAINGLFTETLILFPFAMVYVFWFESSDPNGFYLGSSELRLLLIGLGLVTTVPLVAFAAGARRLPLGTIGFLQYLAPSISLIVAVFLYQEPFTRDHLISFSLIWVGLILYSIQVVVMRKKIP